MPAGHGGEIVCDAEVAQIARDGSNWRVKYGSGDSEEALTSATASRESLRHVISTLSSSSCKIRRKNSKNESPAPASATASA